jgi:hypothetical protein
MKIDGNTRTKLEIQFLSSYLKNLDFFKNIPLKWNDDSNPIFKYFYLK